MRNLYLAYGIFWAEIVISHMLTYLCVVWLFGSGPFDVLNHGYVLCVHRKVDEWITVLVFNHFWLSLISTTLITFIECHMHSELQAIPLPMVICGWSVISSLCCFIAYCLYDAVDHTHTQTHHCRSVSSLARPTANTVCMMPFRKRSKTPNSILSVRLMVKIYYDIC